MKRLNDPRLMATTPKSLKLVLMALLSLLSVDFAHAARSVSQYGITISWSEDRTVGQYVTGDYYIVVGAGVTITNITPASVITNSTRVINGAMWNPDVNGFVQGYDTAMFGQYGPQFVATNNVARPGGGSLSSANPLVVSKPGSLVCSVSRPPAGVRPQLDTIAVFTFVASAPRANSFRPTWHGTDKSSRWTTDDLNYAVLKSIALPSAFTSARPLAAVEGKFQRPWYQNANGFGEYNVPVNNMEPYGREAAQTVSDGLIWLNSNVGNAAKTTLFVRMVQAGIDMHGAAANGMYWYSAGGILHGRKPLHLLAGAALGSSEMLSLLSSTNTTFPRYAYASTPTGYPPHHDDRQSFIVTAADIGRTLNHADGRPREEYLQIDVGLDEWGEQHERNPGNDGRNYTTFYRDIVGSSSIGYMLMLEIMGLDDQWGSPSYFRYMDRYKVDWYDNGYLQSAQPYNIILPHHLAVWNVLRETQLTRPLPPRNVAAGIVSTTSAAISWSDISKLESGYVVQRSTGGDVYTTVGITSANATNIVAAGLSPNTTYYFRVGATNNATGEWSGWARGASITTPPASGSAPAVPNGVTASPVNTSSIRLSWVDAASNESGYNVERSLSSTSGFSLVATLAANSTTFLDVGLQPGNTYYYRVQAYNGGGASAYSVTASATLMAQLDAVPASVNIGSQWLNFGLTPQTGRLVATFDAVPASGSVDVVIGLSPLEAVSFPDLAAIVRFAPSGIIDVRNGSGYAVATPLNYVAGLKYHVSMSVDVATRKYSVVVTPQGGAPVVIADDWSFRTEQASAVRLANLAAYASPGSLVLSNFSISNGVAKPSLVRNPVLSPAL